MIRAKKTIGLLFVLLVVLVPRAAMAEKCKRCGWRTPKAKRVVKVRTAKDLLEASSNATAGTTILLEDGEYVLSRMVHVTADNVTIRGRSRDRSKVIVRGAGMNDTGVGVGFSVAASGFCVADLSVGRVGHHGIQVRGELGVKGTKVHRARVFDCGQQLLKGSVGADAKYATGALVGCSLFEYTDSAPSDYTNGVDVIAGVDWIVRGNEFRNIRGPRSKRWAAGPAVLFWGNSKGTIVEDNLVVDCYRGIALGLKPGLFQHPRNGEKRFDHEGGVIRRNRVVNRNRWADEGIEVNGGRDVLVESNTVFVEGKVPWSISLRFGSTTGAVRRNLSNRRVIFRDGAAASLSGNLRGAKADWFVDIDKLDLRLVRKKAGDVDVGAFGRRR